MKQFALFICTALLFGSCSEVRNERLLDRIKGEDNQNSQDLAKTDAYSFLQGVFKVSNQDSYNFNSQLTLVSRTIKEELLVDETNIECELTYKSGYSIYTPSQEELKVLEAIASKVATMKLVEVAKQVSYVDSSSNDKAKCESYVDSQENLILAGKPKITNTFFEKASDTTIIEVISNKAYNK